MLFEPDFPDLLAVVEDKLDHVVLVAAVWLKANVMTQVDVLADVLELCHEGF